MTISSTQYGAVGCVFPCLVGVVSEGDFSSLLLAYITTYLLWNVYEDSTTGWILIMSMLRFVSGMMHLHFLLFPSHQSSWFLEFFFPC